MTRSDWSSSQSSITTHDSWYLTKDKNADADGGTLMGPPVSKEEEDEDEEIAEMQNKRKRKDDVKKCP